MRTTTHAQPTERIALPRRLVPRRPRVVTETLKAIANPPPQFEAGDLIQFEDRDGNQCWLLILDIRPCGHVDAAIFNGKPHSLDIEVADLLKLRIVRIERFPAADVEMYRRILKPALDAAAEVAA